MKLLFRIISLGLVLAILTACQRGLYNSTYSVKNSTNDTLHVEWEKFSPDTSFSGQLLSTTRIIAPGDTEALFRVEFGLDDTKERETLLPSTEIEILTVRITDEMGGIIYMGVVDDDWQQSFPFSPDNDIWTLEISQ